MLALELKKRLRLKSTFITKNNITFYPMKALHVVLRSRFWEKTDGHWVITTTTISGVNLMTLTYAWSQRGISYLLPTFEINAPSSLMYQHNFEDESGNVDLKMLPRPQVCHFLYDYILLINEHNEQCQYVLHLEKKWPPRTAGFVCL
jgi:hypothetical protein